MYGKSLFCMLILTLGLGGYYWFYSTQEDTVTTSKPLLQESMSGVHLIRFDENGRLIQKLDMQSWEHLKDQTITCMHMPALTLYEANGDRCIISSTRGEGFHADLKSSLEKLHLTDNVIIQHINQHPDTCWQLHTASLLYFPHSQTALTDDPVTLSGPSMVTHSQGLRAYFNEHRIEFINQVNSQYAKSA